MKALKILQVVILMLLIAFAASSQAVKKQSAFQIAKPENAQTSIFK